MGASSITVIVAIIGMVGTISGVVLGWKGNARANRYDAITDTSKDVKLQVDVEYIKRGIDDLRVEQKAQGKQYDDLAKQVARIDESVKSAHHRLNRLEGGKEN